MKIRKAQAAGKQTVNALMEGRCPICGLPGVYEFGEIRDGSCKFCRGFKKKNFLGEERLVQDLDLQEGERIGIALSGGKDSCFMAGKLVDLLGAGKVSAFFFYKPGITSEVARKNVHKVVDKLGIELVTSTDERACARFRKNLGILLRNPDPALVRVALCVGCRYGITENLYRLGEKRGITKYISGASYLELAPFKEELLMKRSAGQNIDEGFESLIMGCPELNYGDNLALIRRDQKYKYKNNDTMNNNFGASYRYRLFDFDNYFENIPEKVEREVKERFGWEKTDRSWHFDCIIEDFKDIFYFGSLGYTELDFKLAAMVRYGLITREEALEAARRQAQSIMYSFPAMKSRLTRMGLSYYVEDLAKLYQNLTYLAYEEGTDEEFRHIS